MSLKASAYLDEQAQVSRWHLKIAEGLWLANC